MSCSRFIARSLAMSEVSPLCTFLFLCCMHLNLVSGISVIDVEGKEAPGKLLNKLLIVPANRCAPKLDPRASISLHPSHYPIVSQPHHVVHFYSYIVALVQLGRPFGGSTQFGPHRSTARRSSWIRQWRSCRWCRR